MSVCPHSQTSRLVPKKSVKGLSHYKIAKCMRALLHTFQRFYAQFSQFHNSDDLTQLNYPQFNCVKILLGNPLHSELGK